MTSKPLKYLVAVIIMVSSWFLLHSSAHAQTIPMVQNPNILTTLVTKKISIGNYAPSDLTALDDLSGSGLQIRQPAYEPLKNLMAAMAAAKVPVKINSAYRSFDEQSALYQDAIAKDPTSSNTVAEPGHSEHQTGLAIDFTAVLTGSNPGFANTEQYKWLTTNAYKYGFAMSYPAGKEAITGYTYEPWHWRYVGADLALQWHNSGLTLTEILSKQPQDYVPSSLVGQVVKTPTNPTVYVINSNGSKRGFIAPDAFLSYNFKWSDILLVTDVQISGLPETKVVKLQGNPTVYKFNSDKTRQAIASATGFFNLGFTWSDIVEINATELKGYQVGPIIQ